MEEIILNNEQKEAVDNLFKFQSRKDLNKASVEGYAGTGKTTMIKYFCDLLVKNKKVSKGNIVVSAPTNAATKIISEKTGYRSYTIQSILGLRPDANVENFNPTKPVFNPIADPKTDYEILIIDEGSMINSGLFDIINDTILSLEKKVIYMGDRYQLPPIGETLSRVFEMCDVKIKLEKVVRQGNNNPTSALIELAVNDVKYGTDELLDYINNRKGYSDFNEKGEGYAIYDNSMKLQDGTTLIETFVGHKESFLSKKSKVIAYTNNFVEDMNDTIRKKILNFTDYFNKGDILIGYTTHKENDHTYITNSSQYEVIVVKDTMVKIGGVVLKAFVVKVKSENSFHPIQWTVVDRSDLETRMIHNEKVNELFNEAKQNRRKWRDYYKFTQSIYTKNTITKSATSKFSVKNKDIDFGYCITTHKSQGSTFDYCFIPIMNMMRCYKDDERRKLLYVAISRASKGNIFF